MTLQDFGLVATSQPEARESPVLMCPGVDTYFSLQIDGTGTLAASSMALYENGTDVSGSKLSGSLSVSGRKIKTQVIGSVVGGSHYRAYVYYTDDDVPQVREFTIHVPRLGEKPSSYPAAHDIYRIAESPLVIYPGQSIAYSLVVEGRGEIEASSPAPTMSMYRGIGNDASSDVLSGALSVVDRTITLKSIGSLTFGSYIFYVFFTDNGRATWRYGEVLCPKLGA